MSLWAFVCSVHLCKSVRERKVLPEWKNTNHVNRKCQYILQVAPFSFRVKAEYATRRCFSTFENMPFLRQEGRFLWARRAYTRMQNITRWFLVGYILGCRWWYMRVVRVVTMVGCKDFCDFTEVLQVVRKIWVYAYNTIHMWNWGIFSLTEDIPFSHVGYVFLSQRTRRSRRF